MRYGALVPALAVAAALGTPLLAEADHHRSRDRGRHPGYERSSRDHGDSYRYGRHQDQRAHHHGYRHGHHRHPRHVRRHHYRHPRHYYRPYPPRVHYRHYYGYRWVRPPYYAPYPPPYRYPVAPPPYRGGVHGSVSVGLPFFGFSLYF